MVNRDKDLIDALEKNLDRALMRLKDYARQYTVGTKVLYKGKYGIVVDLNKSAKDPTGSTVDIKLENGKIIENISVDSKMLEFYRA